VSSTTEHSDFDYVMIWVWLVALLGAGTLAFLLPIGKGAALAVIFGIAMVKASLVVRDYMHLKSERLLIYVIAALPLILALGLALVLIPDIVYHR